MNRLDTEITYCEKAERKIMTKNEIWDSIKQ